MKTYTRAEMADVAAAVAAAMDKSAPDDVAVAIAFVFPSGEGSGIVCTLGNVDDPKEIFRHAASNEEGTVIETDPATENLGGLHDLCPACSGDSLAPAPDGKKRCPLCGYQTI